MGRPTLGNLHIKIARSCRFELDTPSSSFILSSPGNILNLSGNSTQSTMRQSDPRKAPRGNCHLRVRRIQNPKIKWWCFERFKHQKMGWYDVHGNTQFNGLELINYLSMKHDGNRIGIDQPLWIIFRIYSLYSLQQYQTRPSNHDLFKGNHAYLEP